MNFLNTFWQNPSQLTSKESVQMTLFGYNFLVFRYLHFTMWQFRTDKSSKFKNIFFYSFTVFRNVSVLLEACHIDSHFFYNNLQQHTIYFSVSSFCFVNVIIIVLHKSECLHLVCQPILLPINSKSKKIVWYLLLFLVFTLPQQ